MTLEQRIRSDIEHRIHSGEWQPGYKIPFEHELVRSYGCSRTTVSKALEGLARAGLIDRRRKAGSFVARPQVHAAVLDVPDLGELVRGRGQRYRWTLSERRTVTGQEAAPDDEMDGQFLLLTGLHCSDDQPLAYEWRLISLSQVPGAADESFEAIDPGSYLLRHVPWTRARHRIRATAASSDLARRLDIRPAFPCLELARRTWRGAEVVTHVVQTFPSDRYDLTAEFSPRS